MIDRIHDVAKAYRKLVHACSYPGEKVSLTEYSKKNELHFGLSDALVLFAYMLLDAEVNFSVVGEGSNEITHQLMNLTYSKRADYYEADFILITKDAQETEVEDALSKVKVGSLVDPHLSATVIYEIDSLDEGIPYEIKGPGIKDCHTIHLQTSVEWNRIRKEKNKEFPLGIDLYFIDKKNQLLALPRTIQVIQGGE
ncbi:MAG: phosphonate C-P lyase system protein PhnH [Vallitaleaceae bacterium]|nr:phosphonate C-P lyase system protein PhnH [Vallitaleaceae bacterium]